MNLRLSSLFSSLFMPETKTKLAGVARFDSSTQQKTVVVLFSNVERPGLYREDGKYNSGSSRDRVLASRFKHLSNLNLRKSRKTVHYGTVSVGNAPTIRLYVKDFSMWAFCFWDPT